MPDQVPAAPKSGLKTTELYLSLLGLFLAAWGIYALVGLLPKIVESIPQAQNPMLASVVALALSGATSALAWVAHKIIAKYSDVRLQLKLGDFLPLPPGDAQPSAVDLSAGAGAAAAANPGSKL